MNAEKDLKPVIAISIGDLNGIGPEIILKTFSDSRILQTCTPLIFASQKLISFYKKHFNLTDLNVVTVKSPNEVLPRRINVVSCWEDEVKIDPGVASVEGAKFSILSLEKAMMFSLKHR